MARKRTDPLGLSIMAAILATRYGPLDVLDEQAIVGQALRLWRACGEELLKPESKPPAVPSLPKSVTKLLNQKSGKPFLFKPVVCAVVGRKKVADRTKLLRDFLRDVAETNFRKQRRPMNLGADSGFDPELIKAEGLKRMKQMQLPGYFEAPTIRQFAADFIRWKTVRDKKVNKERSATAAVASAEARRLKRLQEQSRQEK